MTALLGIKLGMTRIFGADGKIVPVTAIQAGPCVVTQCKTVDKDGYGAVQIGFGAARHPKKPQVGHTKSLSATPQYLREFRLQSVEEFEVGQVINCDSLEVGSQVTLSGTSKGKGFAGVIKRHNFHRGPETHGSDHHRAPGSIGSMFPQHVLKGHKMPGKMGNERVTVSSVQVMDINRQDNLIFVKGPVPGIRGSLVEISA
ncbi:50S ribosomal protein L3 [Patescibacteria group bacterium]|nr:50S ribosomal protein L3 [Patescibacteria group bacterium]